MNIRFRRSIKLAPGLHLNLGSRGAGLSVGPRGLHLGISSRNGPYASAGIPGTGLYCMTHLHGTGRRVGTASALWTLFWIVAAALLYLIYR